MQIDWPAIEARLLARTRLTASDLSCAKAAFAALASYHLRFLVACSFVCVLAVVIVVVVDFFFVIPTVLYFFF
jgi:hypothetical protein